MKHAKKRLKMKFVAFTIADAAVVLIIAGLVMGGTFFTGEIIKMSRLHSQIAQIEYFRSGVERFQEKYGGLPGDLLAVTAERAGLPAGNGTPSHSDGDGKISPCNPGWQHHLGCETALFWSQLALAGYISGDFRADARLADERLDNVTLTMSPYLPESPLREGIYITVWNTDASQPSQEPRLPYNNYFELSRIEGIEDERIIDNPEALTPYEANSIDRKIDDGTPMHGRILVNGDGIWPDDAWGTFAKPGIDSCVSPGKMYNIHSFTVLHRPLCHLAITLDCCKGRR